MWSHEDIYQLEQLQSKLLVIRKELVLTCWYGLATYGRSDEETCWYGLATYGRSDEDDKFLPVLVRHFDEDSGLIATSLLITYQILTVAQQHSKYMICAMK